MVQENKVSRMDLEVICKTLKSLLGEDGNSYGVKRSLRSIVKEAHRILDGYITDPKHLFPETTNQVSMAVAKICVALSEYDIRAARLVNRLVVHLDEDADTSVAKLSTHDIKAMVSEMEVLSPKIVSSVAVITESLLNRYPFGESSNILSSTDEDANDEAIEKFAEGIDAQVGEGGFAAYMLYPFLYDTYGETQYGQKRHMILGTKASTGKSIMGKMKAALYGEFSTVIGPRPEQTHSGFDADTIAWNESIKPYAVAYIDDDNIDPGRTSREDFIKNFYNPQSMKLKVIRSGKVSYEWVQYDGYVSMNMNTFEESYSTKDEVMKRMYVFYLRRLADTYLTREEISHLHGITKDSTNELNALKNYLNKNIEKANTWLLEYTTPAFSVADRYIDYPLTQHIAMILDDAQKETGYRMVPYRVIKQDFPSLSEGTLIKKTAGLFKSGTKRHGESQKPTKCIFDNPESTITVEDVLLPEDLQDIKGDNYELTVADYEDTNFTFQKFQGVRSQVVLNDEKTIKSENAITFLNVIKSEVEKESSWIEKAGTHKPLLEIDNDELKKFKEANKTVFKLFNGVEYKSNGTAKSDNVKSVGSINIDIDNTDNTADEIINTVKAIGCDAYVVSSMRDKEDTTKLHIIFPLTKPITDKTTYLDTWKLLRDKFGQDGIVLDEQVKDWNRRIYLASSLRVNEIISTGKGIKPVEIKHSTPIKSYTTTPIHFDGDTEKMSQRVKEAEEGERNDTLNKTLFIAHKNGAPYKDLEQIARSSSLDESEVRATFKSATGFELN